MSPVYYFLLGVVLAIVSQIIVANHLIKEIEKDSTLLDKQYTKYKVQGFFLDILPTALVIYAMYETSNLIELPTTHLTINACIIFAMAMLCQPYINFIFDKLIKSSKEEDLRKLFQFRSNVKIYSLLVPTISFLLMMFVV